MKQLILAFLKIFFRNRKAVFFAIIFPSAVFILMPLLGLEAILRFERDLSYADFLLAGIIAFALMQMGIYTAAYSLVDYRRLGILKRISLTPLGAGKFLFAQSMARYVIALLQAGVLLLIAFLYFKTKLSIQVWYLPFLLFAGSVIFLNIGYLIASYARDYEEAAPYSTAIGMSLVFLGDAFFEVSSLPAVLQRLAEFFPMKPLVGLLRLSLFGTNSIDIVWSVGVLIVWLLVTTVLAVMIFEKRIYQRG